MRDFGIAATLLMAVSVAGCFSGPGFLPPGWRQLIVTVENRSAAEALLVVAEDGPVMGQRVGTANPGVVPAGATMEVVFGIPPGDKWALFVNPAPERGPLLMAADVPKDAAGRQPFRIRVGENGDPSWSTP